MTGYKDVTEVCTTPFIYLDGSMYEVLIRSLVAKRIPANPAPQPLEEEA